MWVCSILPWLTRSLPCSHRVCMNRVHRRGSDLPSERCPVQVVMACNECFRREAALTVYLKCVWQCVGGVCVCVLGGCVPARGNSVRDCEPLCTLSQELGSVRDEPEIPAAPESKTPPSSYCRVTVCSLWVMEATQYCLL